MSFTISVSPTLNLIHTCDDTNWNFTVFCLVDVHQIFVVVVCQSILGQGKYFSNATNTHSHCSKGLNLPWYVSPVSDVPRFFPKKYMY